MNEVELTPIEWYTKINERLTLALLKIKVEKRDLCEDDWFLLKQLWKKLNFSGELIFYKPLKEEPDETSEQGELFESLSQMLNNGMVLEKDTSLTNKNKDNE